MFLLVQLALLFILPTHAKILRVGHEFIAKFTVVDANARLTRGYIQNITRKTTLRKCISACVRNVECKSFNRNVETEVCELLSISKYDDIGALRGGVGWEHYDTDDDDRKIGTFCMKFSPCEDYEVCEDTFQSNPAYICRCKDGFEGEGCKTYIGPGKEEHNPATFCSAIFRQSEDIPDGYYWLKGQTSTQSDDFGSGQTSPQSDNIPDGKHWLNGQTSPRYVNCVRRVHGGFTSWSEFGGCSRSCGPEGNQIRSRNCTNPPPKGNGRLCSGPFEETRPCHRGIKCPIHGGWGVWEAWGECVGVCAIQIRYRVCNNPKPKYDGDDCTGGNREEKSCDAFLKGSLSNYG